jgi:DNA end-binding protein Ku
MAAPGSGILSFGLVAIPIRLHTAIHDERISFHLLHKKCGSRVRNQYLCSACKVVVERDELVRGFEVSKGKYVQLTEEELQSLETEANKSIDLKEFIPIDKVDPVNFENAYYVGPDKGGEKPYRLLADALQSSGRLALAQMVSRGKEELVLIRPYQKGLVLHTMFYSHEVKDFKQVPKARDVKLSKQEVNAGIGLIDKLTAEKFKPEDFKDEYRIRVRKMLDEKAKGKEIVAPPAEPARKHGQVIDLMQALKQSLGAAPTGKKMARKATKSAGATKKRKKA